MSDSVEVEEILHAPFSCSPKIDQIAKALAKAQGEMALAEKDSVNPAFKTSQSGGSKYADLTAHIQASRTALSKNDIAVCQVPKISDNGQVVIITVLIHGASGQFISGTLPVLTTQNTMQAIGSGITYARRYGYSAMVGTATGDDDDGNAAAKDTQNAESKPFQVAAKKFVPSKAPSQNPQAPGPELRYNSSDPNHKRKLNEFLEKNGVMITDRAVANQMMNGKPYAQLEEILYDWMDSNLPAAPSKG